MHEVMSDSNNYVGLSALKGGDTALLELVAVTN